MTLNVLKWSLLDWYIVFGILGLIRIWLGWRTEPLAGLVRGIVFVIAMMIAYPTSTVYHAPADAAVVNWSHSPAHVIASCIAAGALIRIPGWKRSRWGTRTR